MAGERALRTKDYGRGGNISNENVLTGRTLCTSMNPERTPSSGISPSTFHPLHCPTRKASVPNKWLWRRSQDLPTDRIPASAPICLPVTLPASNLSPKSSPGRPPAFPHHRELPAPVALRGETGGVLGPQRRPHCQSQTLRTVQTAPHDHIVPPPLQPCTPEPAYLKYAHLC